MSPWLRKIIQKPYFVFLLQLPFVLFFALIILSGLFGNSYRNINTWLVGVGWLVFITFSIIVSGKTWCLLCPWNTLSLWIQRSRLWGKGKTTFSLNLTWPKPFRNLWLASFLFLLLIGWEYIVGLTDDPRRTAYIALIILVVTIISLWFFKRQSFCRYACPVGAVSGIYSILAPLELRSNDRLVCQKCLTKDCIKDNERGYPCPVFEYPGKMDTNLYCTWCTECIRTCPNNNITINWRSPFKEIFRIKYGATKSEIGLIILLLVMSLFGALSLSPRYQEISSKIGQWLGVTTGTTFFFICTILSAILLYLCIKTVSPILAYGFLPLALFSHLSNTLKLFNLRASELYSLISDPFGLRWNLFDTAGYLPKPLIPEGIFWYLTTILVALGVGLSIWVVATLSRNRIYNLLMVTILIIIIGYLNWLLL